MQIAGEILDIDLDGSQVTFINEKEL